MPPPRHKVALLNWVAVYPVITLVLWAAGPLTASLPLYVTTFIVSIVLVTLMHFLVMPVLLRLFGGWLHRGPAAPGAAAG